MTMCYGVQEVFIAQISSVLYQEGVAFTVAT